jgi:hypothetical protein
VGAMAGLRPKTPRRYGASGPTHEFRLAELQFRGLTVNEKFESEGVSTPAPRGGDKSHLMRVAAIMWCCTIHDLQASRDGLHGTL